MVEQVADRPEGDREEGVTAEGCGCIGVAPRSVVDPQTEAPKSVDAPDAGKGEASPTADHPRRPLKLVVTLMPAEDGAYRALLGLGSEGCDPLFRALDAPDLPAALAVVPEILADAVARWETQPHFPSPRPAGKTRPPAKVAQPPAPPVPPPAAEVVPPASVPLAPAAPATKPPSGQIPLFG